MHVLCHVGLHVTRIPSTGMSCSPCRARGSLTLPLPPPNKISRALHPHRFTKPTGLYPTCAWEDKAVRKLILEGRLAPRFAGLEDKHKSFPTKECPICFLRHVVLNNARCCRKQLCTECYLQMRKPKGGSSRCPFCNHPKLQASYGTDDEEKMAAREMANIRLYDMLTAPPHPISFAGALTTDKETTTEAVVEAKVVASGGSPSPSHSYSHSSGSRKAYGGMAIAFATVKERHLIEDEARKQHLALTDDEADEEDDGVEEVGGGLFSLGSSGGRGRVGGGFLFGGARGRQGGGRRAQEHAHVRQALLHSLGVPSQLQQVEELMLIEAIRQSLEEVGLADSGGGGGGGQGVQEQEEETKEAGAEAGGVASTAT